MSQKTDLHSNEKPLSINAVTSLALFENWWQNHGQYGRAGGGDYEKTFAWNAWQAALELRENLPAHLDDTTEMEAEASHDQSLVGNSTDVKSYVAAFESGIIETVYSSISFLSGQAELTEDIAIKHRLTVLMDEGEIGVMGDYEEVSYEAWRQRADRYFQSILAVIADLYPNLDHDQTGHLSIEQEMKAKLEAAIEVLALTEK